MTALVIAAFDRAAPFRRAVVDAMRTRRRIVGLWSPVPVHLPGADAVERPIVPVMAAVGLLAFSALALFSWWTTVHAYPLNAGGRPPNSWPTFLVAPVEVGALAAAVGGALALLWRTGLPRLHDAAFEIAEVEEAQQDRFVLAIRCDAGAESDLLLAMLGTAGAVHTRVVE